MTVTKLKKKMASSSDQSHPICASLATTITSSQITCFNSVVTINYRRLNVFIFPFPPFLNYYPREWKIPRFNGRPLGFFLTKVEIYGKREENLYCSTFTPARLICNWAGRGLSEPKRKFKGIPSKKVLDDWQLMDKAYEW